MDDTLEKVIADLNLIAQLTDEARVAYSGHHASGTFRRVTERLDAVRTRLAALSAGRVLVPREPTEALMEEVLGHGIGHTPLPELVDKARKRWARVIAAAPKQEDGRNGE